MDGENTVVIRSKNLDVSNSIAVYMHSLSCASSILLTSGYHVAITASGQASLQVFSEVPAIIVDRYEAFATSAKSDLIAAIIPPVIEVGSMSNISEFNHIVNLSPSMFTDPSI